ncbi:hypothetical protein [Actinomadura fibrosa]|uniref:DUF11 domain-containing protein n=1 Tax=Actinomadura fibrosa TaxID=111802 RepID=A0ABW2XRE1_9ACTN|nr:hypothetical protein [Actinomadura fibrosa]
MSATPLVTRPDPGERVSVITYITAKGGSVSGIKVTSIKASSSKATVGGECAAPFTSDGCAVGKLADGERDRVTSTVQVPKSIKKTLTVKLSITVTATDLAAKTATTSLTYVVPKPSPTPTPTKTKPKPSKSPSPTPSSSSSGGSGSGSGGSGGSGSGSGGTTGTTTGAGGAGSVLPSPNSSFGAQNPQVALPPIAAPSPSVAAPSPGATVPVSRIRNNKAPVAQELTFERMASTQIAWLAALLVAFSLLLTQLRLGRRNSPAAVAARKSKGAHRRGRRGMFAK